ncbi:MAG: electron transport complex subunit RsxC [Clostridiales bacterium]|nr:electron transport complex subunit RsxC [Clostridiales bacterium]
MNLLSFKGGIHPPHSKEYTENKPIKTAVEPSLVHIPLRQHIGAPASPLVKVGDIVKVGQKIGEAGGFVSVPIHASISGIVKSVKNQSVLGGSALTISIENDLKNEIHESVLPKGKLEDLSGKEIIEIIKEAGIVGMGGAGFPTHVKLSPPPDKKIDVVILNGAECEPYLTNDYRLMIENPEEIIFGMEALMKIFNLKEGYIGIENNKPEAFKIMTQAAKRNPGIKIVGLKTKYPQGAEKQLINAITGRQVPSGGLPMEVGAVVNNVATAAAIANAIQSGMPLIERICTVTGRGVKDPQNIRIKIGTMINEIVEQCGGYTDDVGKLIMGGPMMGIASHTDKLPSTKTTSGILVFTEKEAKIPEPSACIKCGKCVEACPSFLQPSYISAYALIDNLVMAEKYNAMDCIECGSCSFVCPSKRPLVDSIRIAKREILEQRRKSK